MSERKDFVLTDNARVASIQLGDNEASPWHYHNDMFERVICLSGSIEVQMSEPASTRILNPGDMAEIESKRRHRLVNLLNDASNYLLVQCGEYDFVSTDSPTSRMHPDATEPRR
jgi:quercetin dioxygenase-like cupin family protein